MHAELYKKMLESERIQSCGFNLAAQNEKVAEQKIDQNEAQICKKLVEKGIAQSLKIKKNPLTQNFAIGKRGRPPKFSKNDSKLQKTENENLKDQKSEKPKLSIDEKQKSRSPNNNFYNCQFIIQQPPPDMHTKITPVAPPKSSLDEETPVSVASLKHTQNSDLYRKRDKMQNYKKSKIIFPGASISKPEHQYFQNSKLTQFRNILQNIENRGGFPPSVNIGQNQNPTFLEFQNNSFSKAPSICSKSNTSKPLKISSSFGDLSPELAQQANDIFQKLKLNNLSPSLMEKSKEHSNSSLNYSAPNKPQNFSGQFQKYQFSRTSSLLDFQVKSKQNSIFGKNKITPVAVKSQGGALEDNEVDSLKFEQSFDRTNEGVVRSLTLGGMFQEQESKQSKTVVTKGNFLNHLVNGLKGSKFLKNLEIMMNTKSAEIKENSIHLTPDFNKAGQKEQNQIFPNMIGGLLPISAANLQKSNQAAKKQN